MRRGAGTDKDRRFGMMIGFKDNYETGNGYSTMREAIPGRGGLDTLASIGLDDGELLASRGTNEFESCRPLRLGGGYNISRG